MSISKKPLLVVGTGVNKWLLPVTYHGPLTDWSKLLAGVAEKVGVEVNCELTVPPTVVWEEILLEMVRKNKAPTATKAERNARIIAKKILEQDSMAARAHSDIQCEILNWPVSDIVCLNFEAFWIPKKETWHRNGGPKKNFLGANIEVERLYRRITIHDKQIWFPNGNIQRADSLRLGLRDFGFQASALKYAFDEFKSWEKKIVGGDLKKRGAYLKLLHSLAKSPDAIPEADNWVRPFMLRPVIFCGVGLSESEQGLWWLLAQRARNFARLSNSPKVYILQNEQCISKARWQKWNAKPLGIEPIWCRDWCKGWASIKEKTDLLSECR